MGQILFQAIEFSCDSYWAIGDKYRLSFTSSGNLQLWNVVTNSLAWETGTTGHKLAMQADGNLTIYDAAGQCVWSSGTFGNANAHLVARDDGTLAICSADHNKTLWTNDAGSKPDEIASPLVEWHRARNS